MITDNKDKMNLHEYQTKILLKKYGLPIPPFAVASTRKEVEEAIEKLSLKEGVVKVQIHAGGEGKSGGSARGQEP